ncbi:hypothetical protein FACS1894181_16390 [Bacteroidia bacterium]|nr:hypothetical protein FACS1894181_16390 [Bacteroidia bacterium]
MENKHDGYSRPAKIGRVFFAAMLGMAFAVCGLSAQERQLDITPGDGQAVVAWDEASVVDSVVVKGLSSIVGEGSPLASPLTVGGLNNGQLYAFEVYFHSTEWPVVDVGVLYAIPGEPVAPRNVAVSAGHKIAVLTWQPPVDGKDYTYKLLDTLTGEKKTIGSNITSYTLTGLADGQTYTFRLIAAQTFEDFPGKGEESWSRASVGGVSGPIAVLPQENSAQANAGISAYNGSIQVTTPEAGELKVFTLAGQPYFRRHVIPGTSTFTVPKGIYFVTLGNTQAKVSIQ